MVKKKVCREREREREREKREMMMTTLNIGFKMSSIRRDVLREPSVEEVCPKSLISSPHTFKVNTLTRYHGFQSVSSPSSSPSPPCFCKTFDVSKVTIAELEFVAPFSMEFLSDTECHVSEPCMNRKKYTGGIPTPPVPPSFPPSGYCWIL